MSELVSESDKVSRRLKNLLLPSAGESGIFVLLSVIFLVVFNTGAVIGGLDNNTLTEARSVQAQFVTFTHGFSASFTQALGGRLGQVLLWAFVGALAYIGLWLARNVLNSFENDIISDRYVHPSSYSHLGYWGSSLSVKIFLAATVLITAGYGYIFIKALMPDLAALTSSAVYNFEAATSPLYIVGCVLAGAVLLYLFLLLVQLISHLWQRL